MERGQERFDRAVAYFNARRFHEAHEDWEELWHEAEGDERLWLQGLVQVAAAFYHFERGYHDRGFAKLLRAGHEKIAPYRGRTWGMRQERLLADLAPWRAHAEAVAAGRPMREDAPGPPPAILHEEGVVPRPLPLEPEDEPP